MTDSSHEKLDRHVTEAKERLFARLDVLDHRARQLVQEATNTTRATAFGFAGALALSFAFSLATRANRRIQHLPPPRRSILGETLKIGAVALMFVGVSAWAKRASQQGDPRRASQPQLRHSASSEAPALAAGRPSAAAPGIANASMTGSAASEVSPLDTERHPQ